MPKKQDLELGSRFGRLTVISKSQKTRNHGGSYYNLQCDCTQMRTYSRSDLIVGKLKSCGCLRRELTREKFKGLPGAVSWSALHTQYEKGAQKRKIKFELTIDECLAIFKQNCFYCNSPPVPYNVYINRGSRKMNRSTQAVKDAWILANGIDRKDPKKGYEINNIVACCSHCNYSKLDYTEQEYIEHCQKVAIYQGTK